MSPFEIVMVSGKGGTGKTTLTACFAALAEGPRVLADADVDAPNLGIILSPRETESRPFFGMKVAHVDEARCTGCGECLRFCRFGSILMKDGKAVVDPGFCEGCGGCLLVCPEGCIEKRAFQRGVLKRGETDFGPMWHARLAPGGENSGMLVALVRKEARQEATELKAPLILVDGPPGVGCPATSSLTGAGLAVLVVEPSRSALADLRRVIDLCGTLSLPFGIAINRWDISPVVTEEIRSVCEAEGWPILGAVPFDEKITRATSDGRIPVEEMGRPLVELWRAILQRGSAKNMTKIKIGIPSLGAETSSAGADRFARAPWFVVADESGKVLESFEGTGADEAHGAATKMLTTLSEKGVSVLLVPRLGPNAINFAKQAGMSAFCAEGLTVADALAKHTEGKLEKLL